MSAKSCSECSWNFLSLFRRYWVIAFFLLVSPLSFGVDDYPSGAATTGRVVSVGTFTVSANDGMVRFVVRGVKANGQQGDEAFWIDTNHLGGRNHYANVLAASAAGKGIYVYHYGSRLDYAGQTAYQSVIVFVLE